MILYCRTLHSKDLSQDSLKICQGFFEWVGGGRLQICLQSQRICQNWHFWWWRRIEANWRQQANVFIIDCNLNESWHGVSLCNDWALPSVWFKIAIYNVCPQPLLHQVTIVLLPINSPATFHKMFEIFCSFNFMEDIQYFGWQKKDNSRKFSILKFSVSSFCHCARMTTRQKSKKVPVPVSQFLFSKFKWTLEQWNILFPPLNGML